MQNTEENIRNIDYTKTRSIDSNNQNNIIEITM